MVRECVHELLAEKYIERSINEMAGTKKRRLREHSALDEDAQAEMSNLLGEQPMRGRPLKKKKPSPPSMSREEMARKYNLDQEGPMVDIFQDTMNTNPVINGYEEKDPPGTVSESVMEKSGIMSKDWTPFL